MSKAWRVPFLKPEKKLKICLAQILKTRLREAFSYTDGVLEDRDIEAVHSMRISLRRIQVTMKIFRDALPTAAYKRNYKNIKILLDAMGRVRELDVLLSILETAADKSKNKQTPVINLFIASKINEREKARRILLDTLKEWKASGRHAEFIMMADNLA